MKENIQARTRRLEDALDVWVDWKRERRQERRERRNEKRR